MRKDIEFKSEGVTVRGDFYIPEKGKAPYPALVMAGGWCYVKEIVMPHYAKFFLDEGIACLLIDYRTFGVSDGEPRQHLDPWKQIEDYKNAVSFAETLPEIDPTRVGVWGISYSGGHALIVGATDPRVKCIVSMIPVIDGYEFIKHAHGTLGFRRITRALLEDRKKRFENPSKRGYIPMSAVDPDKTLCSLPWPEVYEVFTQIQKTEAPRHEHRNTIESVELCMSYTVLPYLNRILDTPTIMIVAEGDDLTQWDQEINAFSKIASQEKKLYIVPKTTHMTLYSDQARLEMAGKVASSWVADHFVKPYK
jgi:pimeloyl-ACP methyl ester carboxylesterase